MGLKLPLVLDIQTDTPNWVYNLREQPSSHPTIGKHIATMNPYNKPQEHFEEINQAFSDREELIDALEYCMKYLPSEKQDRYDEYFTLLKRLESTI